MSWAGTLAVLAALGTGAPEPAPTSAGVAAPAPTSAGAADVEVQTDEAGPVTVSARIRPDPSNIGDVLELEVVAAFPRGVTVNVPSGLSFEPLHLVSITQGSPESTGEGLRKVITIELQHFDVGAATVPAFDLTYVTADGGVETVQVPAQSFTVDALLANEADPQRKPEDPPISIEYPNTLAETVIYSVLGTAVLGLVLWLVLRRFFRRQKPVVVEPPVPPHELALAALDRLREAGLIEAERYVEHYLELTEITKGYLEGRFGIEALDRTTDELTAALRAHARRIEPIDANELISFLQSWDLVKFARFAPSPEEAEQAVEYVRGIVERTAPRPAQAEASAASEPAKEVA